MYGYGDEAREREIVEASVKTLKEEIKYAPELEGVSSGVKGLDDLFFKIEDGERKSLGGYPKYAVINLTGIPDTGKSLMAEQFIVKQASLGNPSIAVTVETPADYYSAGLKERAKSMGIKFEDIEDNIIIIDAASYHSLRENIQTLLDTLAYAIKKYKTKNVIIDSITGLYEAKEVLARQIVRRIYNFLKKWHQTSILVSQKRGSHEEISAEAAGGYAVSHIVDCSIVLGKKMIMTPYEEKLYKKPVGELIRLFYIDGCRVCGHDTKVHLMEITEKGLVEIKEPLSKLRKFR
ncbi:KaiC domain-containing protein [Candidatus Pacearchaeota archaeon]|nr:MAG: KaiC domain-containing protein [Candidatus Pacearchaeota archaeon]